MNGKRPSSKQSQYLESLATDSPLFFGEGVFTTAKFIDGQIEYLSDHLERLQAHAAVLGFSVDIEPLRNIQSPFDVAKVKIIALRDMEPLVQISECPLPPESPRLCVYPEPVLMPLARLKTISYLDRLWLKRFAEKRGFYDCITTDDKGYILETSRANIFWIEGDTLYYPDPELPYLFGIQLKNIIKEARMKTKAVKAKIEDIPKNAAIYICNCLIGKQATKIVP